MDSFSILIADDYEPLRCQVRAVLEARSGWFVCGEAADGIDAIEKADRLQPDLVLMDISMPRLDGLQAARQIRTSLPSTQVVILTQNDPGVALRQSKAVGASGWISKVNLQRDLLRAVENAFARCQKGDPIAAPHGGALNWLRGGGEVDELMRSTDWSAMPLGAPDSWSPALRMMVNFMLANRFPQLLWWGPQFYCLYNDAYIPVLGEKHPWALGRPVREVWGEIWHILSPLVETPFNGGPATWMEDIELDVKRRGFIEETHFTVAYSPVPDETAPKGIGGVLATVHEITEKVIAERRVVILKELGAESAELKSAEEACEKAARVLSRHTKDVPFALLYLFDPSGETASLSGAATIDHRASGFPVILQIKGADAEPWSIPKVIDTGKIQLVENLAGQFPNSPTSASALPVNAVAVVPLRSNLPHQLAGFMIVAIGPRLQFDEVYKNFLELMSTQISTTIATARAYDEERKRSEALAEIDRAKTVFFSNVSHEFRTPLTLMLGPLEDLLSRGESHLSPTAKDQLEMVNRNGARLLRLVNTLLDFSRIEAGRVKASYQPTDLATFTSELASCFRSATERAGLRLVVDCESPGELAYVDRDMWEKIVLNLLSNAFKFTFDGEIRVTLKPAGRAAELEVRDTGVGILPEALPHIFDRFHRVPNIRSRTHEGSGIGLALVNELVKLHGGTMRVESAAGRGTSFFVTIPLGQDHLPQGQVGGERSYASTATGVNPYVEEALRWLPESADWPAAKMPSCAELLGVPISHGLSEKRYRVLVADDNADMRQYLVRLLSDRYDVTPVADGNLALREIRTRPPDLVLCDVMMPVLDGFALLSELRSNPATTTIPVILLSARAGEESRVEGLAAGADDYMTKPFSSRELLARVSARLSIAQIRKEAEENYRTLAETLDTQVRTRTRELEDRNAEIIRQAELLRELSWRLMSAQDDERRHIARELHDTAGQTLSLIGISVAQLVRKLKDQAQSSAPDAESIEEMVQQLHEEIRTASYLLHPPLLDESGLASALSWYVQGLRERSDIDISLRIPKEFGRLPRDLEMAIFRLVQECLTNIHRHSGSKVASILIGRMPGEVTVEVRDHGKGMSREKLESIHSGSSGVGIRGMRERLLQFKARMNIESGSSGTAVSVTIPIAESELVKSRSDFEASAAVN